MASVTVLGGGHGVAAALEALRDEGHELTAVVTLADDGGSSGELRRRCGGAAVGDLRRALIALSTDPLSARLAERIPTGSLGAHPVGNLLIRSLTDTFGGDLQAAVDCLGAALRARGRVIGATVGEVSLIGLAKGELLFGESAVGAAAAPIDRLRFSPSHPEVAPAAVDAVSRADVVLLGPGSLFTSVLAVAALPTMKAALAATTGRIVWICNLSREPGETRSLSGGEHLQALQRAGIRIDAVLHDPAAAVHLAHDEIARAGAEVYAASLAADGKARAHDPVLLRSALRGVVDAGSATRPASSSGLSAALSA